MRIRTQQINTIVGDISGNTQKVIQAVHQAEKEQIDLLVLQELVVCGYPPMDLLEKKSFIQRCEEAIDEIISETKNTAVIFGAPLRNPENIGRPIINAAIYAEQGEKKAVIAKTLLPTYDVFDEFRYFEPNAEFSLQTIKGIPVGITICEDIWRNENEINYHTYNIDPAHQLADLGAKVIINISASPYSRHKPELRLKMLRGHAQRLKLPIIYANQVGANTEIIFDGDSMMLDREGNVVERCALFTEDFADAILDEQNHLISVTNRNQKKMSYEEGYVNALILGLRDYLEKSGLGKKVILGLSGGIDSALTAVIACEAVGAENVLAITMPSEFSSEGSVSDSQKLAEALGMRLEEIPIKNLYDSYLDALQPLFEGTAFNVAEENIQSRSRGVLLMAVSNKFGHVLLNTGNKSEMAVGYCTLYGDMAGGLSVISDVYKTEVFAICRWLNEVYYGKEVIPEAIITKPPSAELRPDQKDTDSLPEYDVLDTILKAYIEEQLSVDDICKKIDDRDLVLHIIRMVDRNEYKRRQAAPGLRVSPKAFGVGRRLPIVQRWTPQQ